MPDPVINRFAVSLLSKSRSNEALNGEVLINKDTGEILVKSTTGVLTSYDKHARSLDHLNDVTNFCFLKNLLGDIYGIELDSHILPKLVTENTQLVSSPLAITTKEVSKILFSIDLDMFKLVNSENVINDNEPLVELDICVFKNLTQATTHNLVRTIELSKINTVPFYVTYPTYDVGDTVSFDIELVGLKFIRNSSDPVGDTFNFLLHNLLCAVI